MGDHRAHEVESGCRNRDVDDARSAEATLPEQESIPSSDRSSASRARAEEAFSPSTLQPVSSALLSCMRANEPEAPSREESGSFTVTPKRPIPCELSGTRATASAGLTTLNTPS